MKLPIDDTKKEKHEGRYRGGGFTMALGRVTAVLPEFATNARDDSVS
jgi:hypothetical protein